MDCQRRTPGAPTNGHPTEHSTGPPRHSPREPQSTLIVSRGQPTQPPGNLPPAHERTPKQNRPLKPQSAHDTAEPMPPPPPPPYPPISRRRPESGHHEPPRGLPETNTGGAHKRPSDRAFNRAASTQPARTSEHAHREPPRSLPGENTGSAHKRPSHIEQAHHRAASPQPTQGRQLNRKRSNPTPAVYLPTHESAHTS